MRPAVLRRHPATQMRARLSSVRAHRHRVPLLRPFVTAARRTDSVEYVVAEVVLTGEDADGRSVRVTGQGSAAETAAVTGETAQSIERLLMTALRPALEGRTGDLRTFSRLIAATGTGGTSAKAALEVALHDAWGQAAGIPLAELLGGRADGAMPNDMTVSLESPETMAAHARAAFDSGTRILKIKLGSSPEADRRRLGAVVEAVPEVRLRLDANQGWSVEEACRSLAAFAADGLPVDLVEQPVAAADTAGLARVRAESAVPIMADESVWSPDDARRLVDAQAADLFNIKLAKTGGIAAALEIADVAQEAGLKCMMGAMMEPRISITAAAHLAFAHPAVTTIDLDSPAWFAEDVPDGGFAEERGMLRLCGGPGLGLRRLPPEDSAA